MLFYRHFITKNCKNRFPSIAISSSFMSFKSYKNWTLPNLTCKFQKLDQLKLKLNEKVIR